MWERDVGGFKMKRKLWRGLAVLAVGYALLFTLRLGYGCVRYRDAADVTQQTNDWHGGSFDVGRKNYASAKVKRSKGKAISYSIDQKYEKIADLSTTTADFKADQQRVRRAIKQHAGLVQFEQTSGLANKRRLQLAIGVEPDRFDALVNDLRQLGKLAHIRIHKADKTNDYKELNAKRISLEKARSSLIALKGQGGKVDELIRLEERILKVEEDIQNLGIQLGEFDEENEFCTVKLSLIERVERTAAAIPWYHRAKVAFEWTTLRYLQLVGILCAGLLLVFILLLALEKLRALQRLVSKLQES